MKRIFSCLSGIALLFLSIFSTPVVKAQENSVLPFDPMIFMVDGVIGVETEASVVLVNGIAVGETITIEGKTLRTLSGVQEGEHTVQGVQTVNVDLHDLQPDETLSLAGFEARANSEDWGRAGVAYFVSGDYQYLTLTGWGYEVLSWPAGTEWWDQAINEWVSESRSSFYTQMRSPYPVIISPPPVEKHVIFLPMVNNPAGPPACLKSYPNAIFYWQVESGLGVCAENQPASISGIVPVPSNDIRYNWVYQGVTTGWVAPGDMFNGIYASFIPGSSAVGVYEMDTQDGKIYSVYGFGYQTVPKSWAYKIQYWESGRWLDTPNWALYNGWSIIKITNR